jgi:myo-inositol-1(or 4)-monophosphatase
VPDPALSDIAAIVAEAGQLALNAVERGFNHWEKVPGQPLSDVDLAVNDLLRRKLTDLLPTAGWLSEESADDAERLWCERVWIVDPIDGTRDFVRGRRGWSISVALVERGEPWLAVLEAPALGLVYSAERGAGTRLNGVRTIASTRSALMGARVPADELPQLDHDLTAVTKPNSIALRIAMVATNHADLVASVRWGYEWDLAAAALIAEEAGAKVTDALGSRLRFNSPDGAAFGVLASAPGIHDAALERLSERAQHAHRQK